MSQWELMDMQIDAGTGRGRGGRGASAVMPDSGDRSRIGVTDRNELK
jgi:hypothetical protein